MAVERDLLFGKDLLLHETISGMDLTPGSRLDLARAEGPDNISQALRMRLMVRLGELAPLGWPSYGSRVHELIGEPNNRRTRTILMAHARNAVEQDPRVKEVTRIQAEAAERDSVRLTLEIELIHQQTPLNLVFDVNLGAA